MRLRPRATKGAGENAGSRRRNLSPNFPAILRTVAATRPTAMADGVCETFHRQAVRGEGRIEDIVDGQPFMKDAITEQTGELAVILKNGLGVGKTSKK
jgi:hypothetical protein